MHSDLIDISKQPEFQRLAHKRRQLRVIMTGLMLFVFGAYTICWAYFPSVLNLQVPTNSAVTVGIWFTVVVVVLAILLSAYYALIAGNQLDELNNQLRELVAHDD